VIVSKDVEARRSMKAKIESAVANGALSERRVRVDRSFRSAGSVFPSSSA